MCKNQICTFICLLVCSYAWMPDSVRPLYLDILPTALTCRIWDSCLWTTDQLYLTPWAQVSEEWGRVLCTDGTSKCGLWGPHIWSGRNVRKCTVSHGCHVRHQKRIPTPHVLGKSSSMPALKGLYEVIEMYLVINAYNHKYRSVYSSIWKL